MPLIDRKNIPDTEYPLLPVMRFIFFLLNYCRNYEMKSKLFYMVIEIPGVLTFW